MFIKVEKSTYRYKKIQELVIYIPDDEVDSWIEVEGTFSLDQYYDPVEGILIPYPYKPHPSAIFDFEVMEWKVSFSDLMFDMRYSRKVLLLESDGAIASYTDTGQPVPPEWIAYRQALRDLPSQPGVPYEINWPVKPRS